MAKQNVGDKTGRDTKKKYTVKFLIWQRAQSLEGVYPGTGLVFAQDRSEVEEGSDYDFQYNYDDEIKFIEFLKKK
jgi:hypothetical protein